MTHGYNLADFCFVLVKLIHTKNVTPTCGSFSLVSTNSLSLMRLPE